MQVKTFQADSMSEALRMVKAELGPDAMIISSRKERRKGIFGYFRKPVFEITAALDHSPRQRRPEPNPYVQAREDTASTREEFQKSMLEPLVREIRELKDRVGSMTSWGEGGPVNGKLRPETAEAIPSKVYAGDETPRMNGKKLDMEKIRELLIDTVAGKAVKPAVVAGKKPSGAATAGLVSKENENKPAPATYHENLLRELKDSGLDREICGKLIESVNSLPAGEESGAKDNIRETLGAMVRCAGAVRLKKNGPRVIALVGPTGVGKTTTIAKLAAMYALKRKVKVALVTTDTFRAGAVEQLKTYANILRVPMETASTKKELAKALEGHADKDIILVDTAGKSSREGGKLDDLDGLLKADPGIERHLCLSATTRDDDLHAIVEQFMSLPVHRILFTKLDESRKLGCLVNVPIRNNLPISYVTNGQRVPEDIEIANGRKLSRMVVG
jgi:flagellar biosynthesis protein FlhF